MLETAFLFPWAVVIDDIDLACIDIYVDACRNCELGIESYDDALWHGAGVECARCLINENPRGIESRISHIEAIVLTVDENAKGQFKLAVIFRSGMGTDYTVGCCGARADVCDAITG